MQFSARLAQGWEGKYKIQLKHDSLIVKAVLGSHDGNKGLHLQGAGQGAGEAGLLGGLLAVGVGVHRHPEKRWRSRREAQDKVR